MTEIDGEIRKINLPYYTEDPWLHKRNGLYYLTHAAFAHQGTSERICYATALSMEGPWTYQGLLTDYAKNSYAIHPSIIEFKGQSYLFYHHADLEIDGLKGATGRRAVCVDYLYYNPDGTMQIVEQTVKGLSVPLHFTMTTFQEIRYALFHFNYKGINGGYADFDNFTVDETCPHGFRPIPYAKTALFKNKAENASFLTTQGMDEFFVDYSKQGRVVLRTNDGNFVSVDSSSGNVSLKKRKPDIEETFQWIELDDGSVALLSLATNRYLTVKNGNINALTDIPAPDRKDGASFEWISYNR